METTNLSSLNNVEEISSYMDSKCVELQNLIKQIELLENESYKIKLAILELKRTIKDKEIEKNKLDQVLNKSKALKANLLIEVGRSKQKFFNTRIS